MAIESIRQMTVEEYFAFEESSEIRHEYIDGEVYPMTGGTVHHGDIITNTGFAFMRRLVDRDCKVYVGHVRHCISPARYLYPDVSVVCGARETDGRSLNLYNPTLVAEVISPATAERDRGEKRQLYRSIPSLRVYLVIDQYEALVEVDRRQAGGWRTEAYAGLEAIVPLPALDCELPLAEVYAGVAF